MLIVHPQSHTIHTPHSPGVREGVKKKLVGVFKKLDTNKRILTDVDNLISMSYPAKKNFPLEGRGR